VGIRRKSRGAVRRLRWYASRTKQRMSARRRRTGSSAVDRPESLYEAWVQVRPGHIPPEGAALKPAISILMAVHDPPPRFLEEAIRSVRSQSDGNWELVISDDGSRDPAVAGILSRTSPESRVTLVRSDESTGIVGALNRAIVHARGAYVGILDHDDLLHPRTIEVMNAHLRGNPDVDLAYSDEDKVDPSGRHFDPYFKPDYSPELLLGSMYLNHFTAMRSDLVREVGGFRTGTDGAQDHDLAFRMLRAGARTSHVPGVLYHWRAWSGSTATGIQAKPWAQTAAAGVQRAHLEAIGFPGTADPSEIPGLNEVHPAIVGTPTVSIVIPTASRARTPGGTVPLVNECIDSVLKDGGYDHVEIIVVHTNGPTPSQRSELERRGVRLVTYETRSFNFSKAVNLGVQHASGDYLLLLNDDTTIRRPGSIRHLLEIAQLPDVGAVGARLSYPDGRTQHAGILLVDGLPTHPFHGADASEAGYFGSVIAPRNCSAVTGAALMTARAVYNEIGGLDEAWPHDYQDVDYCLRLVERGMRIAYAPYAHFTHVEGASLVREAADPAATTLFRSRWSAKHASDPYYSVLLNPDLPRLYQPL
jgi:O-antigen biosynthesis protein